MEAKWKERDSVCYEPFISEWFDWASKSQREFSRKTKGITRKIGVWNILTGQI